MKEMYCDNTLCKGVMPHDEILNGIFYRCRQCGEDKPDEKVIDSYERRKKDLIREGKLKISEIEIPLWI